jgi:exopolysaccharide biosynthesis polyprenyl glycosylphosphotransferase
MYIVTKNTIRDSDLDGPWDSGEIVTTFEDRYTSAIGGNTGVEDSSASLGPFRARLILTDMVLIAMSLGTGLLVSSRASAWGIDPILAVYGTPVVIGLVWFGFLMALGSYDQRIIGLGTEEARRAVLATLLTFSVVAGVSYLIRADISRAYAFISLPLGLILIVGFRVFWRRWLYRQRARGKFMHRTVVIGSDIAVEELTEKFTQDVYCGYLVVGSMNLPRGVNNTDKQWLQSLDEILDLEKVDAVAIDPGEDAPHNAVQQLAWHLEGRRIDLLISPGMLDLAGPRLTMRPASGLPLLHLDEATLSRPQRTAKRGLDLFVSLMAVVILSPVFLVAALAIRLTSRGPILFKQTRIGRGGTDFTMFKFRTMLEGADDQRDQLRENYDLNEPQFKLKSDPRVTKVGRVLRRWSIDELPQFFNVLGGSMSVVGPRPHPVDDVHRYEIEAFRRLALKPGLTGLWQVSGRSHLTWAQSLKLDIYYIERWTLLGDILLMFRTIRIIVRGTGAM